MWKITILCQIFIFIPIAGGGTKIVGVFYVKNHDFTPKNHIFSNFRGGVRWIRPWVSSVRFYILIFSETTGQIKFGRNVHWMVLYKMFCFFPSSKNPAQKKSITNLLFICFLWGLSSVKYITFNIPFFVLHKRGQMGEFQNTQLPWVGFELTTLVEIGTDCIGSCKSNYHTITTTTAPSVGTINYHQCAVYYLQSKMYYYYSHTDVKNHEFSPMLIHNVFLISEIYLHQITELWLSLPNNNWRFICLVISYYWYH